MLLLVVVTDDILSHWQVLGSSSARATEMKGRIAIMYQINKR